MVTLEDPQNVVRLPSAITTAGRRSRASASMPPTRHSLLMSISAGRLTSTTVPSGSLFSASEAGPGEEAGAGCLFARPAAVDSTEGSVVIALIPPNPRPHCQYKLGWPTEACQRNRER